MEKNRSWFKRRKKLHKQNVLESRATTKQVCWLVEMKRHEHDYYKRSTRRRHENLWHMHEISNSPCNNNNNAFDYFVKYRTCTYPTHELNSPPHHHHSSDEMNCRHLFIHKNSRSMNLVRHSERSSSIYQHYDHKSPAQRWTTAAIMPSFHNDASLTEKNAVD